MIQTAEQALSFIHSCNKFGGKKDDLARMRTLLKTLGSPERLYPVVHIAGTNGKGSTAAIAARILECAGYRTGLFTSPFLVRFNERIRVNGAEIPDSQLVRLCETVRAACEIVVAEGFAHPLEFEVVTALGFLYFVQQKVDIAVIEVGIGGLLDSTNVVDPAVCAITPIGFDHTRILGGTIEEIAAQKAGIIKENRPVVLSQQAFPEAADAVRRAAAEKHAEVLETAPFPCTFHRNGLTMPDGTTLFIAGEHQAINLACALGIVEALQKQGFAISEDAVRHGIETARWDGRCQWLDDRFLIDGAHNAAGAKVLCDYLSRFVLPEKITLLYAAMRDKDISACVRQLAPLCARVVTTDIMPVRGESCEALCERFRSQGVRDVTAVSDPRAALALCKDLAKKDGGVAVACGSLYLAGFVLGEKERGN